MHDVMIYEKKNTPFMRSNAYTNCYEFMFVLSRGKPNTFNPLKVETVRHGMEMLTHNKGADGVNKKVLKELKKEKTRTNIWPYAVGYGGTTTDKIAFDHPAVFPESWRRIISCLGQIPAISSSIPCAAVARRAKWPEAQSKVHRGGYLQGVCCHSKRTCLWRTNTDGRGGLVAGCKDRHGGLSLRLGIGYSAHGGARKGTHGRTDSRAGHACGATERMGGLTTDYCFSQ